MSSNQFNNYGSGRALDNVKRQGSNPYMHTTKRSYAGLIILIVFILGFGVFLASLWEPNELPPKMNQKHHQRR